MDAGPPSAGAVSVRRLVAVLLAIASLCLAGGAPATAATGPLGGTLDLFKVPSPGTNVSTPMIRLGDPVGARAFVGDVNGGKGDIAIGVPNADPGGVTNAGSVYVLFGAGGDFATIDLDNPGMRGYRIDGAQAGDRLGTSIEPLGYDLGGDGLSDFAIGAPGGGPAGAGAVYLVPGARGQRANIDLGKDVDKSIIRVVGAAPGDGAGQALSAPPGTRRLVIGAPRADPAGLEDAGSAFVLMNLPETVTEPRSIALASAAGFRLDGRLAGGRAGSAVGWTLDFDSDGTDRSEILVGAPAASPGANGLAAGEAYIVPFGSRGDVTVLGSPGRGGFVIVGEPGMGLGASVTGMPDLSGDGRWEVAIGAPNASPGGRFKAGSAVVVLSRRTPATALLAAAARGSVIRIDGATAYDNLGTAVAAAQVDRVVDELLVSAPRANALVRSNAGAIYALPARRIASGPIDLAQLGDGGVRIAGPDVNGRSGTELAVSREDPAAVMTGGRSSTGLFVVPAPAPAPAEIATAPQTTPSQIPNCSVRRDIELVIDGSASMEFALPYLRIAIDAMLSKPRTAPINVGALAIGRRPNQVFPPLTIPVAGVPNGRDLAALRLLLTEHINAGAGTPDYTAGLAAAAGARPQASALVLITDGAQPAPVADLAAPAGKRVYVLQFGGRGAPSGPALEQLATDSGGRYFPGQDGATLPSAIALVEAALTCEQFLITREARATRPPAPAGPLQQIGELTLSPRRPQAAFTTRLLTTTKTATLTFSFEQRLRGPASCLRDSPVSLQGLSVFSRRREVARATAAEVQRALSGRQTAFGRGRRVSMSGRCGRGFLVLEIRGLERLGGAPAQAAANSPPRLTTPIKLKPGGKRRKVKGVAVGSAKSKGRGS